MKVIGCDPGVTGAICLIEAGRLLECEDIPVAPNGMASGRVTRWVDARALDTLLRDWSARHDFARDVVTGAIERPIPMPNLPSTTTASSFDTFGVVRALVGLRVKELVAVEPRQWKKFYGLGTEKDASRDMALRFYEDAPVRRARDHNRAEAILVAHWLLRNPT